VVKAEFTAKSDTAKSGNKSGNGTTGGSADDMLQIVYGSTGGLGSGGGSGSGGTGGGGAGASTEQGFHNHFVHSTSTKNDIDSRANTTIPPSTTNTSTHTTAATNSNATTVPSILYTLLPVETEAGVHPVTLILNAFDPANAHDDDPNYFDELYCKCCHDWGYSLLYSVMHRLNRHYFVGKYSELESLPSKQPDFCLFCCEQQTLYFTNQSYNTYNREAAKLNKNAKLIASIVTKACM